MLSHLLLLHNLLWITKRFPGTAKLKRIKARLWFDLSAATDNNKEEIQQCLGTMILFYKLLKSPKLPISTWLTPKASPFPLPPFISTVIPSWSEMETVDLSKMSLWTVCVLLFAPQQVLPKPRRNKTGMKSVIYVSFFFFFLFTSKPAAAKGNDHYASSWPHRSYTEKCPKPALKFSYFLGTLYLLNITALNLNVRKRRNSIWPTRMLFTNNWRKSSQVNDRSALNGRLRSMHPWVPREGLSDGSSG